MSNIRVLTQEQILEAKKLREEMGYTKRRLAEHFEVGGTTIWNYLYGRKPYIYIRPRVKIYTFIHIRTFVDIVVAMRNEGYTSNDISKQFNVPLKEVNRIWIKTITRKI